MSPAEKEARQMMADKKAQDAAEREYNKRSSVAPSGDPRDAVRGQRGYGKDNKQKMTDAEYGAAFRSSQEADNMEQAQRSTPFNKGGKVGSASRRADGIATKGKTRGKMV